MQENVCAVIVTFHPPLEDIANLSFVAEQVQQVVVVDNGSSEVPLRNLREACQKLGVHLIENGGNYGVAIAFNNGIKWALSKGFKWVILFDQDSKPEPGLVEKLVLEATNHPQADRIAVMAPTYIDARTNVPMGAIRIENGELLVAQHSGSLMPTKVFQKEGWFDEKMFIDCVDYDFCLRARDHGWIVDDCKTAVLLHKPNDPQPFKLFGRRLFTTTNYVPLRRYYITRNVIWLLHRYRKTHFKFCLNLNWSIMRDSVKIVGENNSLPKFRAAFRGFVDGIFRYVEFQP